MQWDWQICYGITVERFLLISDASEQAGKKWKQKENILNVTGYNDHTKNTFFVNKFSHISLLLWYRNQYTVFSPHSAAHPSRPKPPQGTGFTITFRHTSLGSTPLDEWSARRRDLYLTTHSTHKRQTSIHTLGGIQTRNYCKQEAPDPPLRRHCHWDQHIVSTIYQ
jgi:hypothetical protein